MCDAECGEDGTPPRTPMEKTVAGIWEDVLSINDIAATDNFFELGGHSLLAVQVMARIQEVNGGEELPIRLLIQSPTVAELARTVEQA